jgi:hypothetical protein
VRVLAAALALPVLAFSHEVITTKITWSREVSRVLYPRCAGCHSEKSAVPLMTYAQARPWAKAIKDEVLSRRMPPWGAVKGYGEFKNDPSLTQEQIDLIAKWVEGGSPEGDPKLLPPRPAVDKTNPIPGRRFFLPPRLDGPVTLLALEPQADAPDVRIKAVLPDGRIVPLIRLYSYKSAWKRTFEYVSPIALPKGTRIEFDPVSIPVRAVIAVPPRSG